MGLPWRSSVWKSACQCRGHEFDPWSRKTPHAAEQLSLCTTTTDPTHPRACALQQEKLPQWEVCALAQYSQKRNKENSFKWQKNEAFIDDHIVILSRCHGCYWVKTKIPLQNLPPWSFGLFDFWFVPFLSKSCPQIPYGHYSGRVPLNLFWNSVAYKHTRSKIS